MNASQDLPVVLFLGDVARILRCSTRTAERLNRADRLPKPLPIPGRPRWARDAVVQWLGVGGAPGSAGRRCRG